MSDEHSIRVGVVGATGKMGTVMCRAVLDDPDLQLVAAIGRSDRLEALTEGRADVAVDFTHPHSVMDNARWYLDHGIHAVIGTTGIPPAGLDELRERASAGPANMVVADDFSLTGAVMLHIAKIAAHYLPSVELSETCAPTKADAPSGTTAHTARELAKLGAASPIAESKEIVPGARGGEIDGIRVHSLRLWGGPGFEEIRFAAPGETLTIVQVPYGREPMANGAIRAVKAIRSRPGFTYRLEALLRMECVR